MALAWVFFAGGCATELSPSTVAADPTAYEGERIRVAGEFELSVGCSAVACIGDDPCNACSGLFVLTDPETREAVILAPSAEASYLTFPGPAIGCVGNEAEMRCAPGIPIRITAVEGTLRRGTPSWGLWVDRFELDDGPAEQLLNGVRLVNAE